VCLVVIEYVTLMLRVWAAYAVPVMGSLAVLAVFFVRASDYQMIAASVPLVLSVLFARGAFEVNRRFVRIVDAKKG
jgi:hypothetical protein